MATSLVFILIGTGVYYVVEDLDIVDSFYLAVITLTTVGYGDLAPTTTVGRIFTSFYILIGVGLIVALVSEVSREVVDDFGGRPRTRRRERGGVEGGDSSLVGDLDDGLADD